MAQSTLRAATAPGVVDLAKMQSSVVDLSKGVLSCYHKTARFQIVDVVQAPWSRQSQYAADNSAVMKIRFSGVSRAQYEMTVAVMVKDNKVRTAVLADNALVPYNRKCQLEEWTGAATSDGVASSEIANKYACSASLSPERLVKVFIDKGIVGKDWYANEDSVAYYSAKPGFTAFGLPLVAIAAFEEGSSFFGRSPGTSPGNSFALVVQSNVVQTSNALRSLKIEIPGGSGGNYPSLAVGSFASSSSDPLPKSANPRLIYTQVLCLPRV